ncbi:MAG: serine/threonine-protein kinase [Verrucomicrobiota bacterium]
MTALDCARMPSGGDGAALVGQYVADYCLVHQIKGGGMAWVYEATCKKWPRRLVVKLPAGGRLASVESKRRFDREIRAVAELSHPNIVAILDYGESEGVPFMVMNLVDGQPLADWLAEENPDLGVCLAKFNDLCRIVAAVHREGKLHRDLKPGNVVVEKHGELHLLDFGLVRSLQGSSDLTAARETLGTPNCMAPEQVGGTINVGSMADVYSLGVILHWLLTGQYPIALDGLTSEERYYAIKHKPPTKPGSLNQNVPPILDELVLRCLEKEPARRPADASELRSRFEQMLKDTKRTAADWMQTKVPRWHGNLMPTGLAATSQRLIESAGGAVPLKSPFYIERRADRQFLDAAARSESVILIHGPRQIGKTSLLARGLEAMRHTGRKVVLVDFQAINKDVIGSLKSLYLHLGSEMADQLSLPDSIQELWDDRRADNTNFERFLTRRVLAHLNAPLIWAMDEVDRLFLQSYSNELFGMFRSWHNARALNPEGSWSKLSLVLAYSAEARMFITDLNQSPFNIGMRVDMEDFSLSDLNDLNGRHDNPLDSPEELQRLYNLVSGHPFLVRVAFNYLVTENVGLAELEANAIAEHGPFTAHLRHAASLITDDISLLDAVSSMLGGAGCPGAESYYQLHNAGLVTGDSPRIAKFRCILYAGFFKELLANRSFA